MYARDFEAHAWIENMKEDGCAYVYIYIYLRLKYFLSHKISKVCLGFIKSKGKVGFYYLQSLLLHHPSILFFVYFFKNTFILF